MRLQRLLPSLLQSRFIDISSDFGSDTHLAAVWQVHRAEAALRRANVPGWCFPCVSNDPSRPYRNLGEIPIGFGPGYIPRRGLASSSGKSGVAKGKRPRQVFSVRLQRLLPSISAIPISEIPVGFCPGCAPRRSLTNSSGQKRRCADLRRNRLLHSIGSGGIGAGFNARRSCARRVARWSVGAAEVRCARDRSAAASGARSCRDGQTRADAKHGGLHNAARGGIPVDGVSRCLRRLGGCVGAGDAAHDVEHFRAAGFMQDGGEFP